MGGQAQQYRQTQQVMRIRATRAAASGEAPAAHHLPPTVPLTGVAGQVAQHRLALRLVLQQPLLGQDALQGQAGGGRPTCIGGMPPEKAHGSWGDFCPAAAAASQLELLLRIPTPSARARCAATPTASAPPAQRTSSNAPLSSA